MSNGQEESVQESLKAALWYAVGKIVDDESLRMNVNATPQFIGALTELVWTQAEYVAQDLETFARHANRTQIGSQDVLLLARRTEALQELLREEIERVKAQRQRDRDRERNRDRTNVGRIGRR